MSYCLSYAGYSFDEINDGSGFAHLNSDGTGTASRILICDWGDAAKLAAELRGYTIQYSNAQIKTDPATHPLYPDMFVNNITIQAHGRPTGENTWEKARLNVEYATLNADEGIEYAYDIGAEVIELSREGLTLEDGAPPDVDIHQIVPTINISVNVLNSKIDPFPNIFRCIGFINQYKYLGITAGKLLYQGGNFTKIKDFSGNYNYNVTHRFSASQYDWRKIKNPRTGNFEFLTDVAGNNIYDERDFVILGIEGAIGYES